MTDLKENIQKGTTVPVLARFYGIIIRMYFQQMEHNPPHFHAIYNDRNAVIAIADGRVLEGELPQKAFDLGNTWLEEHRTELLEMWETQKFKKIKPLE